MSLRFPVGDLRAAAGFGDTSVAETAPFGPGLGAGGGFSPLLVLSFQGITADVVAPYDGYLRLVPAPGDPPGAPSVIEIQPLVTADSLALADGLDGLAGELPAARTGLLPRVRLRAVDPALVEAALAGLVSQQVTSTDPIQQPHRLDQFRAGAFGVVVAGGDTIASGVSGVDLELATSDGTPVDPVAYYSYYLSLPATPGELLADRDWCSELFTRLTRRALVQAVDEHGLAWADPIRVLDGGGGSADVDVSTTGGMLTAARFPVAGGPDVLIASIELPEPGPEAGGQSADRYLLTSQWPGGGPEPLGAITLAAPNRPSLRRFVVTDLRRWLASQHVAAPAVRLPRYTLGNNVIALVDGLATFELIRQDLEQATAPGGFYYLTAWAVDPEVPLDGKSPEKALTTLLKNFDAEGGKGRVLVWDTFHTESAELQATVAVAYSLAVLLLIGGAHSFPLPD